MAEPSVISRSLKGLKSAAMRMFLSPRALRRRLAFEIRTRHFTDLDIVVPLSPRLSCPIPYNEAWSSFYEVFVQQEYAPVYAHMPLPARWLDLGCHAGFFTADVLLRRDRAGASENWEALLIDGDSRSRAAVERFAAFNQLDDRLHFWRGVIASDQAPQSFVERPYMDSTLADLNTAPGRRQTVPVVTADDILSRFPPPYDLIKVDIEGAERDFLESYRPVLTAARFLLVEWHHWALGGITADETATLARRDGFGLVAEVSAPRRCGGSELDGGATCGVLLFERAGTPVPGRG
jgi:FkbM family methyltransferase